MVDVCKTCRFIRKTTREIRPTMFLDEWEIKEIFVCVRTISSETAPETREYLWCGQYQKKEEK